MPLNIVAPPYPVFTDRDGTPLENGYVYLGNPGQDAETNPIQVFWDSALTIPAVQPIRTVYGYLSRNGTPAKLYANDTVSMTVKNVNQEVVFSSLTNLPFDPSTSARVEVQDFTGDGATTQFTLTASPASENNTQVYINGVYQNKDGYSLSGNVLTFSEAPPAAGSSIEVVSFETFTIGETDSSFVSYLPAGVGAQQTTVQAKLRETVSVKDFGAVGDGVTDDTAAIQAALDNTAKKTVFMPSGTYVITDELIVSGASLVGDGVVYASPYGTSAISGTIIKPTGMQNKAAISIKTVANNNKVKVGNLGIDMTSMTAGTLSGDFDLAGMSKGVFIENRHDTSLHDIEVFAVPSNSAAFVFHSLQPGGGMYWGKHDKLASRTKLAAGNDPSAKGFVLLGTSDSITAQIFTDCTSYRGWYLKNVNNAQFIGCHAEGNPKDGVYVDGGNALTFIGGFYEGQGQEDTSRTYYQFYGVNNPERFTVIGLTISGNGINGFSASNGYSRINAGSAFADEKLQRIGGMYIDSAGNVGAPENTSCLGYLTAFNSTVPTATEQTIFFVDATAGFDIANEYSAVTGNYTFRKPDPAFENLTGTYLVSVHLRVQKSGGGAIPAGTIMEFRLGGSSYTGASTIKAVASGQTEEYVVGSTLVRVNNSAGAFMQFKFYHNAGSDLLIVNASGAASDSWFNVCKVA